MTTTIRLLSRTSAIAIGLMLGQTASLSAQPYDALSGIMIPPCGKKGTEADAGTLGAESFDKKGKITPDVVIEAATRGEICVTGKLKLKLRGGSAAMAGVDPEEMQNDPTASAADLAESLAQNGDATAAEVAPVEPAPVETETAETQIVPEAPTAEIQPAPAAPTEETVRTTPEPPMPTEPLAAEGGTDGRDAEPAEVSETTVTEENSRSSSEEFSSNARGTDAGNGSNGGLSNLEKFAIGAAGIVALKAIIGNNREVVSNSGDRVIIRDQNGDLEVLRDDDTLLRRPGSDVKTETFSDGSTRTTVTRRNGSKIVTIADASGRVIKRTRITVDNREILLIDDTEEVRPVDVTRLPAPEPRRQTFDSTDRQSLEAALRAQSRYTIDRRFTLRQVREYREVRDLMPEINIDAINFASGSAAIQPEEAEELFDLGQAMSDFIRDNPDELFLVEGHTDAVGDAAYNLALSDRRAESVALALSEYFDVPPENMIIQGYGEGQLLVRTTDAERANRRAVVRRVTPLLR